MSGIKAPSVPSGSSAPPLIPQQAWDTSDVPNPLSQQFLGKLSQLEKLQYQLTKQVTTPTDPQASVGHFRRT